MSTKYFRGRRLAGALLVVAGLMLATMGVARRTFQVAPSPATNTTAPVETFDEPPTEVPSAPPATKTVARLALPSISLPVTLQLPGQPPTAVTAVGVRSDRSLMLPPAQQVGWWIGSSEPGARVGPTVLAGHLDDESGRLGAMAASTSLKLHDRIVLRAQTRLFAYTVTSRHAYRKTALPRSVFSSTGPARLVLITCGGAYTPGRGYADNVVLTARLIASR